MFSPDEIIESSQIVYEDNHLIIINKKASEIVQGDKTGDMPLSEKVKNFIKQRDNKPGNVFCGVCHRLDRPVSGIVIFAKTSKALSRMNELFREFLIQLRKIHLSDVRLAIILFQFCEIIKLCYYSKLFFNQKILFSKFVYFILV